MDRLPATTAYRFWSTLAKLLLSTRSRLYVLDRDRSAAPGAWILASNHISHFDPPVLSSVVKRAVDWMAMAEMFRGKILNFWCRSVGAFPVNRSKADRSALKAVLDRLKAGRVVGIFPEGGLRAGATSVLEGAKPKAGIAMLSVLSQTPIQPCVLIGTDRLYRSKNWRPGKRIPIWVAFGDPIFPDATLEKAEAIAKIEEALGVAFISLKDRLVREFGLTPKDLPQTPQSRKGDE